MVKKLTAGKEAAETAHKKTEGELADSKQEIEGLKQRIEELRKKIDQLSKDGESENESLRKEI